MQQTLFLMLGYPGAGKTTASKLIQEQTDGVHIWADHERHKMFEHPTHSHTESLQLYNHLNQTVDDLLGAGKTVIYDTNFNFFKDREHLREIAAKHGAQTFVIWVDAPRELAKKRAVKESHGQETRVWGNMPSEEFERMANHLKHPHPDEQVIKLDGANLTAEIVAGMLEKL